MSVSTHWRPPMLTSLVSKGFWIEATTSARSICS
jgi:hypothetical protein